MAEKLFYNPAADLIVSRKHYTACHRQEARFYALAVDVGINGVLEVRVVELSNAAWTDGEPIAAASATEFP